MAKNGLPNLVTVQKGYAPLNSEGMALANLAAWHMQAIGNSGILAALPEPGSSSPMGSAANPVGIFERPWLREPPGSVPFDETASAAVTATSADVVVLEIRVPQGYDGVILFVSNNVLNATPAFVPFSGALTWRILLNNKPIRNFGNILSEKGTIYQGRQESPIRIFSGDLIQYTVTSTLAGTVVCSLTGYFYPSKGVS